MAIVLHRESLELRRSVNTPDFPRTEWIINPDLSAVEKVPRKYWRIDAERVVEMSSAEKAAVDQAELDTLKAAKLEELRDKTLSRLSGRDADYQKAAAAVEAARNRAEIDAVRLKQLPGEEVTG